MITIPITSILLWLALVAVAAVGGIIMHLVFTYPKDPTVKGWAACATAVFALEVVIYLNFKGMVTFT